MLEPADQQFHVTADQAGMRMDAFLTARLGVSRSHARKLMEQGAVTLGKRVVTARDKGLLLEAGRMVSVKAFREPAAMAVTPQPDLPLNVLIEGEGWVVIDKPAGMPVHPLEDGEINTVLNAVVARYPQVQGIGEGGLRSGVVHRLDVETSGALLIATSVARWEQMRSAFRTHSTTKLYRAIVSGRLTGEKREVLDLYVAQHRPAKVRVLESKSLDRPSGMRRCDTTWRAIEPLRDATLLEVQLGTGFLHQIRATLAHIGHPILGDVLYGWRRDDTAAQRPMLHAARLRVAEIDVTSHDPADFAGILDHLRR